MLTAWFENKTAAKTGGSIAKKARLELEEKTQKKVISRENYLPTTIAQATADEKIGN